MDEISGAPKTKLHEIPQIKDRLTFLYLEHCTISREDSAIKAADADGVVLIPSAAVSVLLLGPGTSLTHRAVEMIADCGVGMVWVGEQGVRYYASGQPLTRSSRLLLQQAEKVVNQRKHLEVVRKMYGLRFPNEDMKGLTLQQMRGREGARVKNQYKQQAEKWDVEWKKRDYDPNDYYGGTPINQALSSANVCLYGLAHAVISALGCSPGLGFIHVGHENSFVYDLADLYKAEITIPAAFQAVSEQPEHLDRRVRTLVRENMRKEHILERMVRDIQYLFDSEDKELEEQNIETLVLWDKNDFVSAHRSWA
jgi:CRISPR-associated protein Cas1